MNDDQDNATHTKGRKPDYVAYSVRDTGGGKGFFNKVGAAWTNQDGQGINVSLDAVPVDGRICLRELREEHAQTYQAASCEAEQRPQDRSKNRGRER